MVFIIYLFLLLSLISFGLYPSELMYKYSLVLFAFVGIYLLIRFIRHQPIYIPLWLLPIPLLYLFTLFLGAESVQGTLDQFLVWSTVIAFGVLFIHLKNPSQQLPLILAALSWTMIIGTYFILIKIISFPHFILPLSKELSGLGERLGGFLQYPNAFASFLAAIILFHLVQAMKESKKHLYFLHSFIVLPAWPLFLLTESRGAWLLFAAVWVMSFYVVSANRHVQYFLLSSFMISGGTLLYMLFTLSGTIKITFLSIISLMFLGVIVWIGDRFKVLEKVPNLKNRHIFPLALIVFIVLTVSDLYWKGLFYRILPDSLQRRLGFDVGTFSERVLYWKDSLEHWEQFTWIGLGGKAWQLFMYRIQSSPYLTSEVHNSFLNIWIEIGIVGLIYVCIILIKVGYRLLRSHAAAFPAFLFLLIHGMLEFTFSYPFFLLFLLCLLVTPKKLELSSLKNKIAISSTFILLVSSALLSYQFLNADSAYKAANSSLTREEAQQWILKAIDKNAWETDYVRFAVENNLVSGNEKLRLLEQSLQYEPNHAWLLYQAGKAAEETGDFKKAEDYYELSKENNRYPNRRN
ncbi:O-antigen ligase family protein [Metabacillus sp. B2-18]|uniref:O-antigen ligase family protein n=1 Tax=Metabacillus sp. B2-18 TaxID=2897333 RepID=UPI001E3DC689|nr:O-antigen ligase family protein [Metabacillus sp. B2-18]UGB30482.1 O-antigen ligase family protein [Metabacillus sp. B2-18]